MRSPVDSDQVPDDPLALIARGLDTLVDADVTALADDEVRSRMQRVETFTRSLGAYQARLLAEDHGRRRPGGRPTVDWVREHCHVSPGAAYHQVLDARRLADLPRTARAFAKGLLSRSQVSIVCAALHELRQGAHGEDLDLAERVEEQLHSDAQRQAPDELLQSWHQMRYRLDQEAGLAAEREQYRRRWFRLQRTRRGTYVPGGELDAECGTVLRTVLTVLGKKRNAHDDRTPDQRRADALTELARGALDAGRLPERGGEKPHLIIRAELDTLRLKPGSRLAELDWGATVTGESARRHCCDAILTPVLVDRKGDVLHVGASTRAVPPRMRRALDERDRHCQGEGCDVPAPDCTPHHVQHVGDDGPTTLENLRLYCPAHHFQVHPENERFRRAADPDPP